MKQLKSFMDKFELHFMVVLMAVFLINVTAQIFMRTFFNIPLFFTEEISRAAFLWMVFLGISYATLYDRHIRVSFIVELLPKRVQLVIEIFLHLLAIAIFAWVLYYGLAFVKFSASNVTPALRVPKSFFVAILPLAAFLTIVRSMQKVYRIAGQLRTGGQPS